MSLDIEKKSKVIKQFARSETDTGSPEVQIALLTDNSLSLLIHFEDRPPEQQSRQG